MTRKKIFVLNGSASRNSSNQKLIDNLLGHMHEFFEISVFNDLKTLPHFDPELSDELAPAAILALRENIRKSDGIIICTPEYIFSVPSGLKNALEWCVSTTVFSDKPVGIITASASGVKGHEELQLILKTIMAKISPETSLLIQGVRGKVNEAGQITDPQTHADLIRFADAVKKSIS